jgi:hypothetical protein
MKNAVFWDVVSCRSCVNQRFGGTYRLHLQGRKIRERGIGVSRWLQSAISSSETLVHTRSARGHIPEDGVLQNEITLNKLYINKRNKMGDAKISFNINIELWQ